MPIWYNFNIFHTTHTACYERGIKFIGDLLNPLRQMESRERIITKWGIRGTFSKDCEKSIMLIKGCPYATLKASPVLDRHYLQGRDWFVVFR